jgi:hypothetical protein
MDAVADKAAGQFELNDDQRAIREMTRDFAAERVAPYVAPSVLPGISPTRGGDCAARAHRLLFCSAGDWRKPAKGLIFALVGEMSGRTEGGAKAHRPARYRAV